jgi:hypothetical protein
MLQGVVSDFDNTAQATAQMKRLLIFRTSLIFYSATLNFTPPTSAIRARFELLHLSKASACYRIQMKASEKHFAKATRAGSKSCP